MSKGNIFAIMTLFVAGMIFSPLAALSYPDDDDDYLDVQKAIIDIDKNIIKDIVFKTRGDIPQENRDKNFGYGVVTLVNNSSINVIATTSHPKLGIVDSELQDNPSDPVFHNHYVILGSNNLICGANPAVQDLSFTSPGKVIIDGNKAILKDLPASAQGQFNSNRTTTPATNVTITPGTNVLIVASFLLESHFTQQGPVVCVVDIKPVEPQDKRTIIIGQKDKDYYNEQPRNDDYYNEQPHNDDYYNEQPRNDDYYNEQPRNDDYYNEQPRNDEYNRDDGYNNENTYDSSYGYEDNGYNSYHPY
jgi:hypothetical protein